MVNIKNLHAENASYSEQYMRILVLKLGDNLMIWDALY